MENLIKIFLESNYFWILITVWFIVSLVWVERRERLFEYFKILISKPIIYSIDETPNNVPFYPRNLLESIASNIGTVATRPFDKVIKKLLELLNNMVNLIYDRKHPFRIIGHFIFFGCLLFFMLSDAIAISNTLVLLNLWPSTLPEILTRFDIAVFGGSLLSLIIGTMLVFEIRSDQSEFSTWSERDVSAKSFALYISLIVTILSLISLISWALFRVIELGEINLSPGASAILNFTLYGLVPINNTLSAALCFLDAIRGLLLVGIFLIGLFIGLLSMIDYFITILGNIFPFILDITYRFNYIILALILWYLITPIELITLPFASYIKSMNRK